MKTNELLTRYRRQTLLARRLVALMNAAVLVMVAMKLDNALDWSWLAVLSPYWVLLLLGGVFAK